MLATDQLSDRIGKAAVRPVEKMLASGKSTAEQRVHGLWVLYRLGALKENYVTTAARDSERTVRVHAMRVLSETADWKAGHRKAAVDGLYDRDAYVRRAAADAIGRHPSRENIRPLLTARHRAPAEDVQLVHTIRMALRNQLIAPGGYVSLSPANISEADSRAIADVSLGVKSPESGSYLLAHIQKYSEPRDQLIDYLRHAGRYAPEKEQEVLAAFVRSKFLNDPDAQFASYKSVQDGFMQRGAGLNSSMKSWAAQITEQLFVPIVEGKAPWISLPVKGAENSENPWTLEKRKSADGDKNSPFLSSRPPGETLTGLIRSWPFKIPAEFSFYLAGHDGEPDHPPVQKNSVRLLSADSRQVITNAVPPRQDEAKRIVWDLKSHAGQMGVLEIVDGHDDDGFAWLAVGRINPSVITIPDFVPNSTSQRQQSAADLTRTVPLPQFEKRMQDVFKASTNTPSARSAAGHALISLKQDTYLPLLTGYLADTNQPPALRENLAGLLADVNADAAREAVLDSMNAVPRRLQIRLAQTLARRKDGAERLMALAEEKKIPATILTGSIMKDRLTAAKLPNFAKRYDKLTKDLPPADKELQRLIDRRRIAFNAERASAARGAAVFTKACAVCHQVDGQGALVGPQLDGAGTRGLERLIEDVLDPSRNVDPGFKYSIITTKSDDTITGLFRRDEGETLVFTDATGKDINVRKSDVAERRESELSLMPSNFGEALTEDEFQDLMAFLVEHGSK
jgi:putative heme-binding domain-containing protein